MTSPLVHVQRRIEGLEKDVSVGRITEVALTRPESKSKLLPPPLTVLQELGELVTKLNQSESPDFREFVSQYTKIEHFLSSEANMTEVLNSLETKEKVIVMGEEDFQNVARMLEAMQSLTKYLQNPPIENLPQVVKQLDVSETSLHATQADALLFHEKVEQFLDSYNEIMDLLNQKLLFWNNKLTEWEQLIDNMLKKQGI